MDFSKLDGLIPAVVDQQPVDAPAGHVRLDAAACGFDFR
jgi:hypothetical protein